MHADVRAGAHGGHRLRLREQFRVRAQSDLEIRRPEIAGAQMLLELSGFRASGADLGDAGPEDSGHLGPCGLGPGRIPLGVLLNHAFQHAPDEGHAGGLDRLEVDRRQQSGPVIIAGRGRGEAVLEVGDTLARRGAQRCRRIRLLDQVAHGGPAAGHVDHAAGVQTDHARSRDVGSPDAACERPLAEVLREDVGGREESHQPLVPRRFSSYCWW